MLDEAPSSSKKNLEKEVAEYVRMLGSLSKVAAVEGQLRDEEQLIRQEVDEEGSWVEQERQDLELGKQQSPFVVWRCIVRRMAIRSGASKDAKIVRVLNLGSSIESKDEPFDGWVKLLDGSFALIKHEQFGQLLERVGNGLVARIQSRKDNRRERFLNLLKKQDSNLKACGIKGGDRITSGATDLLRAKLHDMESRLRADFGDSSFEATLPQAAADGLPDSSDMFSYDLYGIARGACHRCRLCRCYKVAAPKTLRCKECGCMNSDHTAVVAVAAPT